jgi:hypothetical protein
MVPVRSSLSLSALTYSTFKFNLTVWVLCQKDYKKETDLFIFLERVPDHTPPKIRKAGELDFC